MIDHGAWRLDWARISQLWRHRDRVYTLTAEDERKKIKRRATRLCQLCPMCICGFTILSGAKTHKWRRNIVCVCVCGGSVASEASRRCSDRTPSGESVTSRRSLLWLCALSHSVRREEESRGDDGKSTNSNKKEEFEYNLIYIIDWQKERRKTFFLPVKASSLGRIVSYKTRKRRRKKRVFFIFAVRPNRSDNNVVVAASASRRCAIIHFDQQFKVGQNICRRISTRAFFFFFYLLLPS